jgi:lipoprotein-releasing system permease protein
MIISHKSKDIGILKSIGVSSTDIVATFSVFSFLIAVIGSAVGLLTAWRFLLHINQIEDWLFARSGFQLWDRNIYSIGEIPNTIEFELVAVIIVCSVAACLLGAFIPSYQVARARPAEVLQVSQL